MGKLLIPTLIVSLIIFIVPMIVYGILSPILGMKTPEGASPQIFLLSVFVTKIGTAIAFVAIFYLARKYFSENWLQYALLWLVMYVIGEVGQAIVPTYSWKEAVSGIISETIYFPISAYIIHLMIKG